MDTFRPQLSKLHYLDNAASEPIRPQVAQAMAEVQELFSQVGANSSSAHRAGRIAAALLEQSRAKIAQALGADPVEVIFTGGGSESVSLAVIGLALGQQINHLQRSGIYYSAVEHESVASAVNFLAQDTQPGKWQPQVMKVDRQGVIEVPSSSQLAKDPPALISALLVGNENGVIQPIPQLVSALREAGLYGQVPVHTDAMQALGRIPVDFHAFGVDALSATGHKFGGPASAGILLLKREAIFRSPLKAAGQERAFRGGTQDVVNAVGLSTAVCLAVSEQATQARRHQALREELLAGITKLPGVRLATTAQSVPGINQLLLAGCEAEALLLCLDKAGVCASAGSACHTGVARPSQVLLAQGYTEAEALGALRISFGWNTTSTDIQALLAALPPAIASSQKLARRH